MSELVLYVVATIVVLAGVAYFFVKQREQEALASRKPARQPKKTTKKETKEVKEPREKKERKPRVQKPEPAPAVLSKKQRAAAAKEEDENASVLDFLKGKKFSTEKTDQTAQAKVKSAPPTQEKKVASKSRVVESESESGSDNEEGTVGYEKVKRKIKTNPAKEKPDDAKNVEDTTTDDGKKKGKKKPKFFTKAEEQEFEAARAAAKAEYEARKNRPPGERRERKPRTEDDGEGEFKTVRERRPRKERTEGENGDENGDENNERRRKFPAREPDQPPVFASEYEAADLDNILNNLTSFYNSNPDAGRPKKQQSARRNVPVVAAEDSKEEVADE